MLRVKTLVLGMLMTNCYVICDDETKHCIIIDPAAQSDTILHYLKTEGLTTDVILLTHGHGDHTGAANELREKLGVKIYACKGEEYFLGEINVDEWVYDRQKLDFLGREIEVMHTPGHSLGSCCYYIADEKVLFAGDTLFEGSFGRTDFEGGSMQSMKESLTRLFKLPDDVRAYPGHGRWTQIAYEKVHNPILMY